MPIKKGWFSVPPKKVKIKVEDNTKDRIQEKVNLLIESYLKPEYVKTNPEDEEFSYVVDIYSKWHRTYLYFTAKYRCTAIDCVKEFFEEKFARLEYIGEDQFNLAYFRHTGQWWEIRKQVTLKAALETVKDDPNCMP